MNNQIPKELYEKFFEIVERGNEAEVRKFLIDNLKKFPQETQDALIVAFFEEALGKKQNADKAVLEFQKQGVDVMTKLEHTKGELQKKLRLIEIKESL